MAVKLDDGKKVTCDICDVHAEDATPKTVKAAYLEKDRKAKALLEQLKAMGYDVASLEQSKSGLVVPVMAPKPQPKPDFAPEGTILAEELQGDDVVDTAILDAKKSRGMVSAAGTANFGGGSVSVAGHASLDATSIAASNLPQDQRAGLLQAKKGKAKLAVVEGRAGQPIVIEEKRVDGMGTTRLKISKKEDDGKLQGRFKKMAKDSIDHDRVPNFARAGYQNTQSECPICHGTCVIVQPVRGVKQEVSCPKCNGAGVISVY
jgi:hypothetical protein